MLYNNKNDIYIFIIIHTPPIDALGALYMRGQPGLFSAAPPRRDIDPEAVSPTSAPLGQLMVQRKRLPNPKCLQGIV